VTIINIKASRFHTISSSEKSRYSVLGEVSGMPALRALFALPHSS
jgi:hypothetical protein